MSKHFKRTLAILLALVMVIGLLPTFAFAAESAKETAEIVTPEHEAELQADIFGDINRYFSANNKKDSSISPEDFYEASDDIKALVRASDTYVEDSLVENGSGFWWKTTTGITCGYFPQHEYEMAVMRANNATSTTRNATAYGCVDYDASAAGSDDVCVVGPLYSEDSYFTNQYGSEASRIANALGGTAYRLINENATIDNIADAVSKCRVVVFDSHGNTDWGYFNGGSDGKGEADCVTQANTSYICLSSGSGITAADMEYVAATNPNSANATFCHAYADVYGNYVIDGTAIANHMTQDAPNSMLWMAMCLGMATDSFAAPLRNKGVSVVYGYSQSVTFDGDYAFEYDFWTRMIAGDTVAQAMAYTKTRNGDWDPYMYCDTIGEARSYYAAFPIVVSAQDAYPGQRINGTYAGTVDDVQTVNSVWTLEEHTSEPCTVTLLAGGNLYRTLDAMTYSSVNLPTYVGSVPAGYEFIGWVVSEIDPPSTVKPTIYTDSYAISGSTAVTLRACFYKSEGGGGLMLSQMKQGESIENGDRLVIKAYDMDYAMYQATANSSYVAKYTFTSDLDTILADPRNYFTATLSGTGFTLGDATNGYLFSSSNNLYVGSSEQVWTLADCGGGLFQLQSDGRNLSYRYDLSAANQLWRMGGTKYGKSGQTYLEIYKISGSPATVYYTTAPGGIVACEHTELTEYPATAATCLDDGNTAYYACTCGMYFSNAEATDVIDEGSWVLEALGHDYGEPVSGEDGTHARTCSRCNDVQTENCADFGALTSEGGNEFACSECGYTWTIPQFGKTTKVAEGDHIVIYNPAAGKLLGAAATGTRLAGVAVPAGYYTATTMLIPDGAAVMTVTDLDENGQFHLTISSGDSTLYLTSGATGNSLSFAAAPADGATDYALWTIDTTSGVVVKNVNAAYNGSAQALEYYTSYDNFTTYTAATGTAFQMEIFSDNITCTHASTTLHDAAEATCVDDGYTGDLICDLCGETITAGIVIPATGLHTYDDAHICTVCGQKDPSFTDYSGDYYIAARRTSGNYFWMTDVLTSSSDKRYTAVDSGLTVLPAQIDAAEANDMYIWRLERQESGIYLLCAPELGSWGYSYHYSGNTANFTADVYSVPLTVVKNGDTYTFSYVDKDNATRYLSLNKDSRYNYFAYYIAGQRSDLSLIPVVTPTHTAAWKEATEADCSTQTDGNVGYWYCEECAAAASGAHYGKAYSDEALTTEIPASEVTIAWAHAWVEGETVAPTCAAPGYTPVTCSVCGATDTINPVDALEHTPASYPEASPTCTEPGSTGGSYCSVCEAVLEAPTEVAALGHDYIYTDNGENHTVTCSRCDYSLTEAHSYVEGVCVCGAVEPVAPIEIKSATLRISENINVIYAAEIPDGYTDPYMVFSFLGSERTVTDYTVNASGQCCFEFADVNPQCMGDNISATLYATLNGETVSVTKAEYSVKDYCVNQLAKTDDASLITLLSDILTYGAAAQTYIGYETDALVTSGLDLTPSTFSALEKQKATFTGNRDASVDWVGATLVLSNDLATRFIFTAASVDGLTVDVTINGRTQTFTVFEAAGEGGYSVTFDGVKATEFGDTVTAAFKLNDEPIGRTVSYSVNTYISSTQDCGAENLEALVQALYNYGASAKAYAN